MWRSGGILAQGQGEGTADEAGAEDGDAMDEVQLSHRLARIDNTSSQDSTG